MRLLAWWRLRHELRDPFGGLCEAEVRMRLYRVRIALRAITADAITTGTITASAITPGTVTARNLVHQNSQLSVRENGR